MIFFRGIDVLTRRRVGNVEAGRGVALALEIPEDRVSVIDDIGDYPEQRVADVVCVASQIEGEFSVLLSIQTGIVEVHCETELDLVQRLSEVLMTQLLVPDDGTPDPYCMILITPGGAPAPVELDTSALDDFDVPRYVICRKGGSRPIAVE